MYMSAIKVVVRTSKQGQGKTSAIDISFENGIKHKSNDLHYRDTISIIYPDLRTLTHSNMVQFTYHPPKNGTYNTSGGKSRFSFSRERYIYKQVVARLW